MFFYGYFVGIKPPKKTAKLVEGRNEQHTITAISPIPFIEQTCLAKRSS
jgi:hypothetical protein